MASRPNEVTIDYTNHKGAREKRRIVPISIHYEKNHWHKGDQWFLRARALDRDGALRMFAMKDIHSWAPLESKT